MDAAVPCGGLPHSEIRGLTGICPCPRLIAACHVLLRLREPRHPSCALLSFPFSESFRLFDSLTSFLFCQLCVGKNPYLGSSCEFALLRFLLRICSFFQFPICQCSLFFVWRIYNDWLRFRYAHLLFSHEVENNGFEPLTPCLQSRCSSQLS